MDIETDLTGQMSLVLLIARSVVILSGCYNYIEFSENSVMITVVLMNDFSVLEFEINL